MTPIFNTVGLWMTLTVLGLICVRECVSLLVNPPQQKPRAFNLPPRQMVLLADLHKLPQRVLARLDDHSMGQRNGAVTLSIAQKARNR